jgi:hypothetical protein
MKFSQLKDTTERPNAHTQSKVFKLEIYLNAYVLECLCPVFACSENCCENGKCTNQRLLRELCFRAGR